MSKRDLCARRFNGGIRRGGPCPNAMIGTIMPMYGFAFSSPTYNSPLYHRPCQAAENKNLPVPFCVRLLRQVTASAVPPHRNNAAALAAEGKSARPPVSFFVGHGFSRDKKIAARSAHRD